MRQNLLAAIALMGAAGLTGCGMRPQGAIPPPQPVLMQHEYSPPVSNVFDWRSVPRGQRLPVERAAFDREGYQITTPDGTILVPFANQNLYVMKFARSFRGGTYFVNQGDAPVLYLADGFGLQNAAAQNAVWYPLPPAYQPQNPVYVGLAPSWNDYTGMGWYPGMAYYGGVVSPFYRPGLIFHAWTPGYRVNIGGRNYANYRAYTNYYRKTPGFARVAAGSPVYHQPRAARYVQHNNTVATPSRATQSGSFNARPAATNRYNNGRPAAQRPPGSFRSPTPAYRNTPRSRPSFSNPSARRPASGSGSPPRGSFPRSGGFGGNASSGRSPAPSRRPASAPRNASSGGRRR